MAGEESEDVKSRDDQTEGITECRDDVDPYATRACRKGWVGEDWTPHATQNCIVVESKIITDT